MDKRFFALSARYIEDELELFVYRYFESVGSPDRYFENCIEGKLAETAGKETGREGKSREGEEEKKEKKQQEAESFPENRIAKNGQFYRGTLRSGQKIEVDGSIVILGDINPGAQIVAGGNVVVLGCLKGTVHAGYPEDNSAFVAALMMEPMQIQIGSYIARSPDQRVKNTKKNAKKKNRQELLAKLAFVENDSIFIETITRSLISEIRIS